MTNADVDRVVEELAAAIKRIPGEGLAAPRLFVAISSIMEVELEDQ